MISLKSFSVVGKKLLSVVSVTAMSAAMMASLGFSSIAFAQDGERQPPPTRSSEVLTDRVFRVISAVSEILNPEDQNATIDYARVKRDLDGLNERYDTLNDFEKSTLLNFYATYYFGIDNINAVISTYERMLTIENLRHELRLRSLLTLGNLYIGEERYRDSINFLTQWRQLSEVENDNVFLMLANNHYQLEEYTTAIPFLIQYMDMKRASGEVVPRNIYSMLNAMYFELEDFPKAEALTKEMITLFDEAADWRNLAAIYGMLDNDKKRVETLMLTFSKGFMESSAEYMNLAQSLAGSEAPYKGALVLEAGFQAGKVEETVENLERLTQMYLMSNEYERALVPARKSAELAETGDAYDYLGYIYYMMHDYKSAADAIKMAVQRGGLDNPADTQLFLARALVEIEDYAGAAAAARRAQELGSTGARQFITYIENSRQRRENLDARKAQAIDFYRS